MHREIISTASGRPWQGVPAIERAANGRLWCALMTGGPFEPTIENYVALTTRAAGEAVWSRPAMAVPAIHGVRSYDGALWHDPDGRLWLFYNQASLEQGHFGVWLRNADDAAVPNPLWSEPRAIDLGVPFAYRLNKPTVLSTGAWLLPITWAQQTPTTTWWPDCEQLQGVAISTDRGQTWSLHGAVEAPRWALECMVVEGRDGRLWMLIRTGSGVLWQSDSEDGGVTWSKGRPSEIVNPGARFFVRRLSSGRLLLINTPHPTRRQGLRVYVSLPHDDRTFVGGLELDPRDRVSYPDAVQAPDGVIYAVHDHDRGGVGEVLLDVFTEQEVLAAAR